MTGRLDPSDVDRLLAGVAAADAAHRHAWPGSPATRQPIQVLYVPADRVTATTALDQGAQALRLLDLHGPDPAAFASGLSVDPDSAELVRERVAAKLAAEPVEDLRVDFEDGYLGRTPEEEQRDAVAAARAVASAHAQGTLPPFVGLRVKSFTDGLAPRSVSTLDAFVGALLEEAGTLPAGFVITFPKIVAVPHVGAFAEVLGALEEAHGLAEGRLVFEAQIETTPSVLDAEGRIALRAIREAAGGRLVAAHVGIYDYTAALGLPPAEQRLDHPACDALRHLLQITFAGTEVRLADGSTNAVPADDTTAEVHRVWRRHAADVRHSLRHGFAQGWDLHASHLVSRYATVFAHLLDGLDDQLDRLGRWHAGHPTGARQDGARPTGAPVSERSERRDGAGPTGAPVSERSERRDGARPTGVLDEPATVRMLEAQVQRAVDCGAVSPAEVERRTGLPITPRPAQPATRHTEGHP